MGAGAGLDRYRLAGDCRLIDRRLAGDDVAVDRDLLARPYDDDLADAHRANRHFDLRTITLDPRRLWRYRGQIAHGAARASQ